MKVGIFSDTHLGFDSRGERAQESFENLEQAINICVQESADVVILAGDVFDAPVPSHDTLYRAMAAFSAGKKGRCEINAVFEKNTEKKQLSFEGLPILAIHGNHEYAGKDTRTALDVLSVSGLIFYFHAGKVVLKKGNERAVVFGLGSVPEKKDLEVLQHWAPKPEKGCANILMTHQGFKEFMAVDDEMVATLSLEDLPRGFDLFVNGHLHWQQKHKIGDGVFILPGSTIATSIKKIEADQKKGVHFFDSETKSITFMPFSKQRRAFYHKIDFKDAEIDAVLETCRKEISANLAGTHEMKPLIRLNLKGTLKKGISACDVNINQIYEEFSARSILSISKNFSSVSFRKKISELREMQKSKLSVAAMGLELLEKNLKETDFGSVSVKELFDLLAEDEPEKALSLITLR